MTFPLRRRVAAAGPLFLALSLSLPLSAKADPAAGTDAALPEIVVTATRGPTAIGRVGSAISVITGEEIRRASPKSVADVLRRVPGLSVVETGGPGGTTLVRLRGSEPRHTLVLVDGIRVNDPSAAAGEFDFVNLIPTDIERIEVLRGPQSALYGSDAIGGVINVITRRGKGPTRVQADGEAGSYGSKGLRGAVSGASGRLFYALSLTGYDTAGFSRYGDRIGRITRAYGRPLEADATARFAATGRLGVALSDDVETELGGSTAVTRAQYDAAFGPYPDTPSASLQRLSQVFSRTTAHAFDHQLKNTLTVFANRTERDYRDISYGFGPQPRAEWLKSAYVGDRIGAEYQGDLSLDRWGLFTVGLRTEEERLVSHQQSVLPQPTPRMKTNDARQTTRSLFALYQVSPADNLSLSLGGRLDDVANADRFATWRATLAYEIPESETVFRTSAGTGAKAPSLFQLYDPTYGTPGLAPERSFGVDAGVDQTLFDGRLKLSGTLFLNRYRDLIAFATGVCPVTQPWGCYFNVARAQTSGFELAADAELVPALLRLKLAYTNLDAVDRTTDKALPRRPANEGRLGFVLTPAAGLSIEPSVVFVGERFSSPDERDRLAPYARLDLLAEYDLSPTASLFLRAENLTNARYEEVRNYATPGRSFYAGLRTTW
ncbi:TonB-dependent receptor [Chelatococcus sp. SYSU_G07232]|uniref:TonB-dependent receptor n=1 Tax=Chelatococcus albus TaxID=3047466 RepID=A0ABT7AHH3_9HYPH|nr:TonB-dependent receptor [Chelatococcus sp. SYSU_G07232]MDJ1158798.1 TonB-dependent receptor [Chelatococcus sp. SYSU_G07232]